MKSASERLGVVIALIEEDLIHLHAVAFAGDLKKRLDAIDRVVIGIELNFLGAHARVGVARVHCFADGQVSVASDGDADGAIVAI